MIFGLDTATLTASIALVDERQILAEAQHDTSGHSADLLVAIDALFRDTGVTPHALDAVAVGAGPGSFTGLRIGMATAKGIAFAVGRPLWAVSSLAALAHDGLIKLVRDQIWDDEAVIAVVLDARRGEVFVGCYRGDASTGRVTLLGTECVVASAGLAARVVELSGGRATSFTGDALLAHRDVLAPLAARWLPIATPSGAAVARLALAGARIDVVTSGAPTYVRPPEAELRYPDGVPGALRRKP